MKTKKSVLEKSLEKKRIALETLDAFYASDSKKPVTVKTKADIASEKASFRRAEIEKRTNFILEKILWENELITKLNEPISPKIKLPYIHKIRAANQITLIEKAEEVKQIDLPNDTESLGLGEAMPVKVIPYLDSEKSKVDAKARRHLPILKPLNSPKKLYPLESSFKILPTEILFKDFLPGQVYSIAVKFTNISRKISQFRFKTASPNIMHTIKPIFLMEKIGADCSTQVIIQFTPISDVESDGMLDFVTETGGMIQLSVKTRQSVCEPVISCVGGSGIDSVIFSNMLGAYTDLHRLAHSLSNSSDRKCASYNNDVLNLWFGDCVLGNTVRLWIDIANQGKKDCGFKVVRINEFHGDQGDYDNLQYHMKLEKSILSGYSTTRFSIEFKPTNIENINSESLQREGIENSAKFVVIYNESSGMAPVFIECNGLALDLPISTDKSVIEFNLCYAETIYHSKMDILNKSSHALRFNLDFSPFKISHTNGKSIVRINGLGTLEVSALFGFVQPTSFIPVWFTLNVDESHEISHYKGQFHIPFMVTYSEPVTKSARNINLSITGQVIDHRVVLKIDGDLIEFGGTSVFEKNQRSLLLCNQSILPQLIEVSSTDLTLTLTQSGKDIKSSQRIHINLDPLQKVQVTAVFEPIEPTGYAGRITCRTVTGFNNSVEWRGHGVLPPFKFSNSQLRFEPISYGSSRSRSLQIKSSRLHCGAGDDNLWNYKFGSPVCVGISGEQENEAGVLGVGENVSVDFFPSMGQIGMRESIGIQITVGAPNHRQEIGSNPGEIGRVDLLDDEALSKSPKNGTKQRDFTVEPNSSIKDDKLENGTLLALDFNEKNCDKLFFLKPKTLQAQSNDDGPDVINSELVWLIPCHLSRVISGMIGTYNDEVSDGTQAQRIHEKWTIYAQIITEFTQPTFEMMASEPRKILFGTQPLGVTETRIISFRNVSLDTIQIKCIGLNPHGDFYLTRAIRPVKPGETGIVSIGYKAQIPGPSFTTLELTHSSTTQIVILAGDCIIPLLQLEAPGLVDNNLAVSVCTEETTTKLIKLINESCINLEVFIDFPYTEDPGSMHTGVKNSNGRSAFSLSQTRVLLTPNSSKEVTLKFSPDRPSDCYVETLSFQFIGQGSPRLVRVVGMSFGSTGVVLGMSSHPPNYRDCKLLKPPVDQMQDECMRLHGVRDHHELKLDDEGLRQIYQNTSRNTVGFLVFDMDVNGDSEIIFRDISIVNLKTLLKLDAKKCECEYIITESSVGFEYNELLNDYVCFPLQSRIESTTKFMVEPMRGVVEVGATKNLKVSLSQPGSDFFQDSGVLADKKIVGIQSGVFLETFFELKMSGGYRMFEPRGYLSSEDTVPLLIRIRAGKNCSNDNKGIKSI